MRWHRCIPRNPRNASGTCCLPLVPLFGNCLNAQLVPAYPRNKFDPEAKWFQRVPEDRVETLLDDWKL